MVVFSTRYLFFVLSIFTLVRVFTACQESEPQSRVEVLRGEAQGTTYSVKYIDSAAVSAAEIDSLLQRFDLSLSAWVDTSVLSRFNRQDSLTIDDDLFLSVFWRGRAISHRTAGAFHPMVMPLVRAWGFGPEGGHLVKGTDLDSLKRLVTYDFTAQPLSDDSLRGPVFFDKPRGIQLDVNAFAQGYSVDVVAEFLKRRGITDFMVEIGGEVYATGQNEKGEDWRIGIDKPVAPDQPRTLEAIVSLRDAALATSGSYRKFYEVDGKKYSHTIDPRTGRPVDHHLLSATVLAANCTDADAYATAFMVLGTEGTKEFLKRYPELGLEVYLIYGADDSLSTYASQGMRQVIEEL